MGYDDRREIFERLEALERLVRSRHDEPGSSRHHRRHDHRDRDCHHHHGHDSDEFDEKRVIDTIVHLVSEHVGRMMEEHSRSSPGGDGGGEKRIVDLIVGLVSEHVEEIVCRELDRRFGRPDGNRSHEGRPSQAPAPPPPPGEPEHH